VDTHNGTNITRQVPSTGCNSEVLDWVQSVRVDHEVAVVLVDRWGLAPVPRVEELGKRLALDVMDGVHIEPGAVAGQDDRVCLGDQMFARSVLDRLFGLDIRRAISTTRAFAILGGLLFWRIAHLLVVATCRLRGGAIRRVERIIQHRVGRGSSTILLNRRL